jgi:hypothetical protein
MLELFIGFISPKDMEEIESGSMPAYESDEFRPFRRAIREYDFWYECYEVPNSGDTVGGDSAIIL